MTIKKWKTLHEDVIFEHPRIVLVEDTVVLPDGTKTKYLKFKGNKDVATVIAINDEDRILLQREYSHPPAEVLYRFPGGAVETDEAIAHAANRELMEECQLRGKLELIGSYLSDDRRSDASTYVFIATNLRDATLPPDVEEYTEHEWVSEQDIDKMLMNGQLKQAYVLATWAVYKGRKRS